MASAIPISTTTSASIDFLVIALSLRLTQCKPNSIKKVAATALRLRRTSLGLKVCGVELANRSKTLVIPSEPRLAGRVEEPIYFLADRRTADCREGNCAGNYQPLTNSLRAAWIPHF
jgi:hypothetical protein